MRSVFASDVDGDGDMDVLSASAYDDKIAWYENNGSESFTAHNITTNADGAYSVFASDVDGDGDMDALSASPEDYKIARSDRRCQHLECGSFSVRNSEQHAQDSERR